MTNHSYAQAGLSQQLHDAPGIADHDVLGRHDESLPGRTLMQQVMKDGERLPEGRVSLNDARSHARREIDRLPARVRGLEPARPPYRVDISHALRTSREQLRRAYAN
jgi:nicotinate phosphoribosyltransferase